MADKHVMETIVKLAGAIDPSLGKSAQKASKALGGLNAKAVGMKLAFAGMAVIAVKALVDIGKGLYNLGKEFDAAYDTIRVGTGATGEELEKLKTSFKSVYGEVPASMEETSKAISDYNTRLGLTGEELETMSKQALIASQLLDEDLSTVVESSSKAMQAWNVDAKDMGGEMDYLYKVSQNTGIGFTKLMGDLQSYGPQMKNLGYSFEESAAMIGQLEKAGLNTNEVLGALKKSVGVFSKEGLDASKGLQVYIDKIKNAGDMASATSLATEIFGAKAGSTMANAIRSGALAIDQLTGSLQGNTETLEKAMWDTADAPEKFAILQHKFQNAIEPLASSLFDAIGQLMPPLIKIIERLSPMFEKISQAMAPIITMIADVLVDLMDEMAPLMEDFYEAVGPAIIEILQELLPPLIELIKALLPAIVLTLKALTPVLVVLAKIIGSVLSGVISALVPIIQNVTGVITNLLDYITNIFTGKWGEAWTNIFNVVKNLFGGMKNILLAPFKAVGKYIDSIRGKFGKSKDDAADLPKLAKGGFTNGVSIAGEAGREAVISFDPAYRSSNISTWLKAGQLLGVGSSSSSNSYNLGGITYSPSMYFKEAVDENTIIRTMRRNADELFEIVTEKVERMAASNYQSESYSY